MVNLPNEGEPKGMKSGRNSTPPEKQLIKIENDEGRLRLRWTYQSKRYAMAIGLPDSVANRAYARQLAIQIELDIISGNFDLSLTKYKPKKSLRSEELSVADFFGKFSSYKQQERLSVGALGKYQGVGHWFSLIIRITPNACDIRIAVFSAINRRDLCPQSILSIFPIKVNQCRILHSG